MCQMISIPVCVSTTHHPYLIHRQISVRTRRRDGMRAPSYAISLHVYALYMYPYLAMSHHI